MSPARPLPRPTRPRPPHTRVSSRRAAVTVAGDELADVTPHPDPGWEALAEVDITPTAAAFLDRLVARLEADLLPVIVTSGRRSPRRQAQALAAKLQSGASPAELYALYVRDDLLREVLAVSPDVDAMADVLTAQARRGQYLSAHMRADAIDLRRWGRSDQQLERLRAHAHALGAHTVLESNHLHVEHLTPESP